MNDQRYNTFVNAAITLAVLADIEDRIATTDMPADRSARADRLRAKRRTEALATFRVAQAALDGASA